MKFLFFSKLKDMKRLNMTSKYKKKIQMKFFENSLTVFSDKSSLSLTAQQLHRFTQLHKVAVFLNKSSVFSHPFIDNCP